MIVYGAFVFPYEQKVERVRRNGKISDFKSVGKMIVTQDAL